ncbi:hypothetical protein OPV22_011842 [Ensete ventricosum]|uniref:Uncharacterized protein n=1 Tax=Ensete ventricosum TaxID=4639 RepID=A0AAV8Q6G8_ENSVE|nr:hypothetical protein OPV22_011842 [Ensete ventricosum]
MPSPDPAAAGVLGGVLEGVGGDSGAQGAPPHEEASLSPSATASGCSWMVMVMVTASQFAAVLITIRRYSYDSLFNTGELALYSIEKDELEGMKIIHHHGHTIFFQKRQAFVTSGEQQSRDHPIRSASHHIYAGNYFVHVAFGFSCITDELLNFGPPNYVLNAPLEGPKTS